MPAGFQLRDEQGQLVLELGGHVLATEPAMLAAVGQIAAEWAHAEAELERCLAGLMDTSPERTFALLKPYKSAGATADGARALAGATLEGSSLVSFNLLIDRFKAEANERNKIQHGLWAMLPNKPASLGRVKAVDYSRFQIDFVHATDRIALAQSFAAKVTDLYDEARLLKIVVAIQQLTRDIIQASQSYLLHSSTLATVLNRS